MNSKQKVICKIYGHDWDFSRTTPKDYVNMLSFKRAKKCLRCGKKEMPVEASTFYGFSFS